MKLPWRGKPDTVTSKRSLVSIRWVIVVLLAVPVVVPEAGVTIKDTL